MELVTGIDWRDGKALALVNSSERGTELIELSALAHRGLPEPKTYARHITFNLQDMQVSSLGEYAEAFGMNIDCAHRHTAWSIQVEKSRLVIPALALLRAFVRPNHILLPQLFKPQSLDDICFLAEKGSYSYVQVHGNLGDIRYTRESTYMGPLSWFFCFPSARQSWASVYQAAKAGHLHVELPNVRVTVASRHLRVGLDCYVTKMSLVQFDALDEPADFAAGHPRSFVTSAHTRAIKRPATEATNYESAAERELSDEEWDAVRSILVRTDHGRRYETCRNRVLLNCILQKLSTDISWRDLAALHDVLPTTIASALARWRADGRLALVMEQLLKLRAPPAELTSGPLPGHEEVVTSKVPCP